MRNQGSFGRGVLILVAAWAVTAFLLGTWSLRAQEAKRTLSKPVHPWVQLAL